MLGHTPTQRPRNRAAFYDFLLLPFSFVEKKEGYASVYAAIPINSTSDTKVWMESVVEI